MKKSLFLIAVLSKEDHKDEDTQILVEPTFILAYDSQVANNEAISRLPAGTDFSRVEVIVNLFQ